LRPQLRIHGRQPALQKSCCIYRCMVCHTGMVICCLLHNYLPRPVDGGDCAVMASELQPLEMGDISNICRFSSLGNLYGSFLPCMDAQN
jgi:hypothetical protein